MKTNCDITIYNKVVIDRETKYVRSHIYGVHWQDTKGANILRSGLESADAAKVYIPFTSGENYLKPKDFKGETEGHFTLQHEDVIVKGVINDDYTTLKELEKKYDNVRTITTVDTKDYGSQRMKHWEVGAH